MNRQLFFAALAASTAASIATSGASAQARSPAPASGGQTARHHSAPPMQSISAVRGANADATLEPRRPDFVNATAVYPFSEGSIYRVYTAPERVTDIALQPGETLVAVASGDTVRWVIGDTSSGTGQEKRVHVLVKPFAAGLATNLVITTDRRTYHVALVSTGGPAMAALSWSYPQDALLAIRRAQQAAEAAAPVAAGLEVESLNFAYEISGDRPSWRPLRAFDDGRQTFIEFPPSLGVGEAPPLFLVDRKGEAQLVNYRLRGRYYVVDRLFDAAELRLGTNAQQRKADFVSGRDRESEINPHAMRPAASPYLLSAGSVIAGSLITGLRSDLPGLVTAQVTERVFDSATGRLLLIPQGARLIGTYDSVVAFGQKRALVVWQRIIFPDGRSLRIENVPATDTAGYAGLADKVDFHTWAILKGVAISTLLGVGTSLTFTGESDLVQAIRESTQQNVSRAGDQLTSRNLQIQPTITIRPGTPVRLVVHRDLVLAPPVE